MEIRINKTTRSLGARALQSWCLETVHSSVELGEQMPKLDGAVFLGEGDLKHAFCFSGTGASSCLCPQKWQKRSQRKTFRGNGGGCVLFSSKGFVTNRKGCGAEIAESIPLYI